MISGQPVASLIFDVGKRLDAVVKIISAAAISLVAIALVSREPTPSKEPPHSDAGELTPEEHIFVGAYGSLGAVDSGYSLRLKVDRSYHFAGVGMGSQNSVSGTWSLQRGAIVLKPWPEVGPWPLDVSHENGQVYLGGTKFGYQKLE